MRHWLGLPSVKVSERFSRWTARILASTVFMDEYGLTSSPEQRQSKQKVVGMALRRFGPKGRKRQHGKGLASEYSLIVPRSSVAIDSNYMKTLVAGGGFEP